LFVIEVPGGDMKVRDGWTSATMSEYGRKNQTGKLGPDSSSRLVSIQIGSKFLRKILSMPLGLLV